MGGRRRGRPGFSVRLSDGRGGKLGSSVARLLHAKGMRVTVRDTDPVRRTQALGCTVGRELEARLEGAGLVLCVGGALSLRNETLGRLRNGAYVATVTSSEDELELAGATERVSDRGGHRRRVAGRGVHAGLLPA